MEIFARCPLNLIALAGLVFFTSCSAMKAGPAEHSGFLAKPETLEKEERLPFHGWWLKEGEEKAPSGKLYIAPVDTKYLMQKQRSISLGTFSREEIQDEAVRLGEYFRTQLAQRFAESKDQRFTVVDRLQDSGGVVEIAIVELVPTDVVRNVIGSVAGTFVPGGGMLSTGSGGSVAIEGRFRKTATNEVVAKFKDREQAPVAPIDLGKFSAFHHARGVIDDWCDQIVEMLESPPGSVVADSSPFTLNPW